MMGGMGSFMRLLGIGENRERIVIKGSDFDLMQRVAEDFRYYLDEQEFIRNTRVSYSRPQPEIRLGFDPILLTSYDISRQNIASGSEPGDFVRDFFQGGGGYLRYHHP